VQMPITRTFDTEELVSYFEVTMEWLRPDHAPTVGRSDRKTHIKEKRPAGWNGSLLGVRHAPGGVRRLTAAYRLQAPVS
jgi:hypothetical protein